jgi:hypothetical protein
MVFHSSVFLRATLLEDRAFKFSIWREISY